MYLEKCDIITKFKNNNVINIRFNLIYSGKLINREKRNTGASLNLIKMQLTTPFKINLVSYKACPMPHIGPIEVRYILSFYMTP